MNISDNFSRANMIYIIFTIFVLILAGKRLRNVALTYPVGHNIEKFSNEFLLYRPFDGYF